LQKAITTLVVLAVAALAAYIWFAGGQSGEAPQRVSAEDRPPGRGRDRERDRA
jgi:membrane fusion protein, multidrug efflux system